MPQDDYNVRNFPTSSDLHCFQTKLPGPNSLGKNTSGHGPAQTVDQQAPLLKVAQSLKYLPIRKSLLSLDAQEGCAWVSTYWNT